MSASFRGRLFWKILLGFWLTFILVSQLLWLGFQLYGHHHQPPAITAARRMVNVQMASAAAVLQHGGLKALDEMMTGWSPDDRRFFSVMPVKSLPSVPSQAVTPDGQRAFPDQAVERVTGADGRYYQLRYDIKGLLTASPTQRRIFWRILNIPAPLFYLAGAGGLLFSLVLAWNLTRPMRQLSEGFSRVAAGDLAVRLFPRMRARHDELSGVAKDFDAMVERLAVLSTAQEALLHDVSHELRSPLARLQMATGLARQQPDKVSDSLDRIDEEARRLDKMIGEILTLSRVGYDSQPGERYFDLRMLTEAVAADARYEAQMTGVEIILKAAQGMDYTVRGNAELVGRAVENVVRNALRFSQKGQQVVIHLTQDNGWLIVGVRDSGPGVEAEKLSSIFEPFVRINTQQAGKGYGLGLSIVRKVVLAHQGEVRADNHPQGGLVVTLRLPHWQQGKA